MTFPTRHSCIEFRLQSLEGVILAFQFGARRAKEESHVSPESFVLLGELLHCVGQGLHVFRETEVWL